MNILIVEDEALAARRLERMTAEILGAAAGSLTIKNTLAEAETHLAGHRADLVLLDLNLNGENGFDLLSRMTAGSFHTIVVSASLDQAVKAFEYGVLDFVPKPYDRERLAKALDRLQSAAPAGGSPGMRILSVKSLGTVRLIPVDDVRFFKGADDYVELHLSNGTIELYAKSMDSLSRLLPSSYYRIHKSYIVNMLDAKEIRVFGGGKYEIELRDGITLPVSRTHYPAIRAKLEARGA
jgi:two-component system, LytTR family, response regulator LytT